jgi:hypothetical protein
MKSDRYIPVHLDEIVESLCRDFYAGRERSFQTFAWLWENLTEHEFGELEESLKKKYFFYSPDEDTVTQRSPSPEELEEIKQGFLAELDALFDRANFTRIGREEFEEALRAGTSRGLKIIVNLEDYEEFRLYFRGVGRRSRSFRNLKTLYRHREEEIDIYLRAATVTKLSAEKPVFLKLFKEIPVRDIESLLPRTKVKMKLFDKMKIGGSTGAAVFAGVRTALKGILFVGKGLAVPLILGVASVYLGKSIIGWFNMRDRYRTRLIRDLFYQNLANNLGVINRLVDAAEEEESSEAVLAYAFAQAAEAPPTPGEIKERIETWFRETWNAGVDFDVPDAVEKLHTRGLAELRDGRVVVVPLEEAARILDAKWDSLFTPPGDGACTT